jgi:hypothetical protein
MRNIFLNFKWAWVQFFATKKIYYSEFSKCLHWSITTYPVIYFWYPNLPLSHFIVISTTTTWSPTAHWFISSAERKVIWIFLLSAGWFPYACCSNNSIFDNLHSYFVTYHHPYLPLIYPSKPLKSCGSSVTNFWERSKESTLSPNLGMTSPHFPINVA